MTDVWNDGATTFKGIGLNVTDTASASGSLLMDLQVGGASRFSVGKGGSFGVANASFDTVGTGGTATIRAYTGTGAQFAITLSATGIVTGSNMALGWSSGNNNVANPSPDLSLFRDAADTLAQRRSTNPQAFRVYNTYTDVSNLERGFMKWDTNVLRIGTEKAGTGSARALELQTDGVTRLTLATDGAVQIPGFLDLQGTLFVASTNGIRLQTRVYLNAPADGVLKLANNTLNNFDRLQFGGTTSSFPALKRSTTSLQVRLADDSAFTNVQGKLTTETAYTAGAPTATGYLVLYDSAGVAYKVPAEAL
jgi:hypothetical protein